jgi:hypothetical protein
MLLDDGIGDTLVSVSAAHRAARDPLAPRACVADRYQSLMDVRGESGVSSCHDDRHERTATEHERSRVVDALPGVNHGDVETRVAGEPWEEDTMKTVAAPISLAGSQLGAARHVCAFFHNPDDRLSRAIGHMEWGLEDRTHPMVIIGGLLQENPFFVPPDEFLW